MILIFEKKLMLKSNFKLKRDQQSINKYSNASFAFMCINKIYFSTSFRFTLNLNQPLINIILLYYIS